MNLYIIPGYGETMRNQGYRRIVREAKKKYDVTFLNLQLKNRLFSELVEEGINTINNASDCAVLGFSIGALIAYFISKKIELNKCIICSLTPAIGVDIAHNTKLYKKYLGRKQVNEYKQMTYGKSKARELIFICGSEEGDNLVNRTKKLRRINNGILYIIENNDHMLNEAYVDVIAKVL